MVEIKTKPSLRPEGFAAAVFFLISFFILLVAFIFPIILVFLIPIGILFIIIIGSVIHKAFLTYTITDENEIIIEYNFISTQRKIYRSDQITSVGMRRSIFAKIFGIGEISFGIFGKPVFASMQSSRNNNLNLDSKLTSIKDYDKVYDKIVDMLDIDKDSKLIHSQKPSYRPKRFWLIFDFIVMVFLVLIGFVILYYLFGSREDFMISGYDALTGILYSVLIFVMVGFFGFLFKFILEIIEYMKIKRTNYSIFSDRVIKVADYFISYSKFVVPLRKITNSKIHKNIISYTLFKTGDVQIYTGGDKDPVFNYLDNYEKFSDIVSAIYSGKFVNLKKLEEKKERGYITKPGNSYYLSMMFWSSIIMLPLIALGFLNKYTTIVSVLLILLYLLMNIIRIMLYKNTSYEFFQDRIISRTGIINIYNKEIQIKNIKHLELNRDFIFERVLNQGTIRIYTPGSSSFDSTIYSIPNYKEVYKEIKEIISNLD